MNLEYRHPDRSIAAWLAEGPTTATSETRRAIAAGVRLTPQRRSAGPMEIARASRLLAAVALLVAGLALVVAVVGTMLPYPAPSPSPSPSADDPARRNGTLERADRDTAFSFIAPRGWDVAPVVLPDNLGAVVFASGPIDAFFAPVDARTHGVTIADVGGATEHGSLNTAPPFGATAGDFIARLDASAGFDVLELRRSRVGELPAWAGTVTPTGDGWDHIDTTTPRGKDAVASFAAPNLTFVIDVGETVVLVSIWAGAQEDLDAWLTTAMTFVDSLRFEP